MLQKIKSFSDKSKNIYVNLITGQEGTIAEIGKNVSPSSRMEKRHIPSPITKVVSNRATTRGRNIYYQAVKEKVIKHVQETYVAIQRKIALLNFYDKIEENKIKWHNKHPEYKSKRQTL